MNEDEQLLTQGLVGSTSKLQQPAHMFVTSAGTLQHGGYVPRLAS
jgi:hypothetical protein